MSATRIASALFDLAATVAFVIALAVLLPCEEREPFTRACKPRGRR